MDNGWQMKLPCSSSRVASSSEQFQFQEPRNQMNMNVSHCILPHDAREQGPLPPMKQAPTSNILNFGAYKSIHPESGSLFHSLLSDTHSPLQYDYQRQANMHSSSGGCILESSAQGNVGTMPNWPLLQNRPNFNTRVGLDVRPSLQPGPVMNANNGNSRGMSDDLDTLRAFTTHDSSRNERVINTPLQKAPNCVPSSSSTLLEASVQTSSLVTKKQNSVVSDCPRVFCMGACGDLLLSNTGLFGIRCSCHGMHMSVSKFCEHSGLSDVNPGYAVRVDSGESIAQWRKLYLQKFGIRAPGDHRGWDWPEGLLATSGLANSSMAVADRRKVFDLSSLFNSSAESSTQLRKNVSTGSHRPTQECSNQMLKNAHWENNGFDHCNMGSFGKNLHNKTDNPTTVYPSLFRPPLPGGNGGPGDGCESRSFHFMSSRENSSSSALQNSLSVGSKTKTNSKDDIVLQRSSIPSTIELKLGQPSQLGWGSGSATPFSVRPQASGVQTTTMHEKLNCNMEDAKVVEINKQHISCHSVSDFSRTKDSFTVGHLNNAATSFQAVSGLTSTNGAAHVEHMENRLHNSFATSVPGPPSNTTAGASLYHKKIIKSDHPFSPWTLHHQPRVDRPVMIDFSGNEDVSIRPLDTDKLASFNSKSTNMDACGRKESSVSELSSMFYAKQMESSGFDRTKKTCNPSSSASLAASSSPLGMANTLSGVSGASNYIGNAYSVASNLDQIQLSSKLRNSSFSFTTPTVQGTSSGFTALSAVLTPGHGSISFSKNVEAVNTHASEESMRRLALRNIDTSCNEKPMDASHVFSQQPRIHSDHRQQSKTCSIPDLREPGLFLDQGPFEGQRHGRSFSVGQIVPPSFLPVAGHKKGMNFGANSEKVAMWSELTAKYSEELCNPKLKQHSPLSGGRQEKIECRCNIVQGSHGQSSSCISDMRNCNVQTVYSKREHEGSGSSSMYGLKKQASIAVVETPKYNSSRLFDDVSTGNGIQLELNRKGKEHHFKSDCGNSQWIENPSQKNSISKIRCPNASIQIVDSSKASGSNLNEHSSKGTLRANQVAELLKEKELSDNSSGCSAPAVAQASNEVNVIDSVTTNSQIADQGSAISRSCSSVEAIDSVKSSQLVYDGKTGSTEEESLTMLENASLHSVINESKQRYTKSSELQNFTMSGGSSGEVSNKVQNENEFKPTKKKRTTKRKTLEKPFTASKSSFLPSESGICAGSAADHQAPTEEHVQVLLQPNINSTDTLNVDSNYNSLKRRRSTLSSVKMLSHKRDLNWIDKGQSGDQVPLEGNDDSINMPENYAVKNLKPAKPAETAKKQIKATVAGEGNWLHNPICDDSMKCSSQSRQKWKPIACGKYGIICDQDSDIDPLKPPKIVPLSQVLKASKRSAKYDKPMPSAKKKKTNSCSGGKKRVDISFSSHRSQVNQFNKVLSCHSRVIDASIQETQRMHMGNTHPGDLGVLMENGAAGDERNLCVSSSRSAEVSKTKEIRMRSLYDLSIRGNKSISADIGHSQNVNSAPQTVCGLEMITAKDAGGNDGGEIRAAGNRISKKLRSKSLMSDTEELCCVCGISNKDNANCLLECGHCLIRIHQACYGISRVPKGDWYCRPCRTSSMDVACVLCGYGGGAMTRAFGSRNVVKGLLKAWNIRTEPNIMCVGSAEALYVPAKMECRNNLESATYQLHPSIKPVVHNSIVSGLFDPTVKQWVHMVCGLWTPGTRCPNVDTMSAFDVSGASHLNDHMICYICNRAGGSCIRCRVETCYTHFHPWCAHHKGLLQSEVEGDDSDQVGFYGRCLLHADPQPSCSVNDRDTDKASSETEREEEPTCARTEGYKGKKQRGGHYSSYQHSGKGGCLVTQVQLDAWQYINRHKLRGNKQPKPPASDVDHDYRKEYTRYKQAKGWKHLVVYKSGIHALGLYTSQFIQRAAVVVEYVGEIVGPRVADKRETEYMTGRKLQYKSACYFFRIDKEQIIDATCKGGIARFVNHSCQPNCVAKVLTVRGDKKVVFFAERDIYPGEEITYDYHFNHEDEGKKIPCFCNSKNCRRYLN